MELPVLLYLLHGSWTRLQLLGSLECGKCWSQSYPCCLGLDTVHVCCSRDSFQPSGLPILTLHRDITACRTIRAPMRKSTCRCQIKFHGEALQGQSRMSASLFLTCFWPSRADTSYHDESGSAFWVESSRNCSLTLTLGLKIPPSLALLGNF